MKTIRTFLLCGLTLTVLVGCASKPVFNSCEDAAAFYKARTGQKLIEPVTYEPNRILLPNSVMTMDYQINRLNVYIEEARNILDSRCG